MIFLYLPVTLVTIICVLYWYCTRTFNYWKNRGVPGPTPVPLFGNIKDAARRKRFIGSVYTDIYNAFPKEKVVGIYRMTTPCILLRDLDVIKNVMIKDFDFFVDRGVEFSKEGLGANLFHSDGETWRVLRSHFTPIFTTGKLKNMLYLVNERADQFVKRIESIYSEKSELEVRELFQRYTISTISACVFGLDIDTFNDEIKVLKKIDELIFTASFLQEVDFMFPGILKKLNSSLFPKFVTKFFDDLVNKVVTQRNGAPINRNDFMDLMLEMRIQGQVQSTKRHSDNQKLSLEVTNDVMAAQAFVFYAAGYETSASTMSFMFYEMAKYPDIQEKVISEVDAVIQKHGGVTYDAINELEYVDRVFKETIRMHTLVDPLVRNALDDYTLPGTDIVIAKGQTVIICPTGIHHDPQYYPEPEKFDPDRFTVENSRDRHPCAYLSFGAGPRNCIGMRFAKMQSLMCTAKFFSKFRVELPKCPEKIEMNPRRIIGRPESGIPLNIIKR